MSGLRKTTVLACALTVCGLSAAFAQDSDTGAAVYSYWCATCHSAGPGMPGTQALQAKYGGNPPAVLTQRSDLTPEFIALIVRTGISVMPPFRKTEITDAQLAALTDYVIAEARSAASSE